jgi:hypothetical protein
MRIPALTVFLALATGAAAQHHHPEGGIAGTIGDWSLAAHGFVNAVHDEQGGPRGDIKNFSNSMFMGTAERPWLAGSIELRSMLSLDPAMGKGGYPLLFQTGETANGTTHLVERQHPHDFFMELGARYRREFDGGAWFAYAALPGEPALGPPAFMHRASGIRIPEAPLTHHWLDSTHISMGVLTLGMQGGAWTFEISRFNGHEPDQYRWNLETHGLDSTAARITWVPAPGWSVQASHGDIRDPEKVVPGVYVQRDTVSVVHEGHLLGRPWATTLAWGRNNKRGLHFHYHLPGWLIESTLEPFDGHTAFIRADRITHDEASIPLTFRKVSLGYIVDIARTGPVTWGIGGLVSDLRPDPLLNFLYGKHPDAYMVFVQARF